MRSEAIGKKEVLCVYDRALVNTTVGTTEKWAMLEHNSEKKRKTERERSQVNNGRKREGKKREHHQLLFSLHNSKRMMGKTKDDPLEGYYCHPDVYN